jgi:hypothetical protein
VNITVEFDVDIGLVKRAIRCYVRDWLARYFAWPIALALILAALIFWRADGLLIGFIAGFTAALYVWPLLTLRSGVRRAMREAGESGLHHRWAFDDEGVTFETSLASARMRWPLIKRTIKGGGVLLLILSERKYYVLPTSVFDVNALDFIAARIAGNRPR